MFSRLKKTVYVRTMKEDYPVSFEKLEDKKNMISIEKDVTVWGDTDYAVVHAGHGQSFRLGEKLDHCKLVKTFFQAVPSDHSAPVIDTFCDPAFSNSTDLKSALEAAGCRVVNK